MMRGGPFPWEVPAAMLQPYPAAESDAAIKAHAVWIDVVDPTEEDVKEVERRFHLQVPARTLLEEIESSSRLRAEEHALFLSMPLPDGSDPTAMVPFGFVLTPERLLTVRYSEPKALEEFRRRLAKLDGKPSSAAVFATLVEAMIDFAADVLEKRSSELAHVSGHVFVRHRRVKRMRLNRVLRDTLCSVGEVGEQLSRIRESLLALQRIIVFVNDTAQWLQGDVRKRLKTARSDMESLVDFELHLSGKTQFLLDATLGFINTEQNDMFKVLTIASVVGIPPTLIASMYGMNFQHMPELAWRYGYPYGLGVIVLSIILPILWFKWKGWW